MWCPNKPNCLNLVSLLSLHKGLHCSQAGGPISSPIASASLSSLSRTKAMALSKGKLASWICSYYHILEREVEKRT